MASDRKNANSSFHVKKMKKYLIICYTFIIIVVIVIISTLSINKTDAVLTSKVSTMTTALNMQMKMNIDSYLSKMETIGTLVFASDDIYSYNAASPGMEEYEAINTEKIISDELFDICIMENFVDFGIVYSNNHTVGKVSNGTVSLFGDNLYEDLSDMITRIRTHDGWATGYMGDFKRIYYVKRINEGALLITSFYTTELETVFEHPEDMIDMTVRLSDNNNDIIYSSDDGEIGEHIPDYVSERINGKNSVTLTDDEYLITVNSCGDNWYVICSIPTKIILSEKNEITVYIILVGAAALLLAVMLTVLMSAKITNPMDDIVTNLDTKAHFDQLTGILNKRSFEEFVEKTLKTADQSEKYVLILLDIDNFKGINDMLGHAYGDKVLSGVGEILRTIFTKDEQFKGRLGGDEFGVLTKIPENQYNDSNYVNSKCSELCDAFHNNYTGDSGDYKISASIGVAMSPLNGKEFEELYKCADTALYCSKKKGKDTYTIYNNNMTGGANEN